MPENKDNEFINLLEIQNFKSIKDTSIKPNKINLFIGEPNSGKSNLLEAINCISLISDPNTLKEKIRISSISNIFYNDLLDEEISFNLNNLTQIKFKRISDRFRMEEKGHSTFDYDYNGNYKGGSYGSGFIELYKKIKFYRYNKLRIQFPYGVSEYLLPIEGENLFNLIYNHKANRERLTDIVEPFSLKPVYRPQEKKIEFQKTIDDELINLPMELISDTVRSIIFHTFAIESNKDSILVFEEPESHTFPYYTKHMGELVSLDKTNQYFIITHNPYFLSTIVEQAPKEKVNVYVTYMENYETKVKLLTEDQKAELLEFDPFLNLRSFIEED